MMHRAIYAYLVDSGPNSQSSLRLAESHYVSAHSVRLEMLIPNMFFITRFRERRAEFRA